MDFFDINDEQLYMFEFLIHEINLTNESKKLIGKTLICVRLKFLDYPIINLIPEVPINSKKKKSSKDDKSKSTSINFNMGKSCLFSIKPYDLIQAIRSKSLNIGIYTMDEKNSEENSEEKEEIPISQCDVLLSGCLCDQIMMSMNDRNHLPKPYVLKNTYNLIGDDGNPFGTITLFLRLSCCGKTIETQFALRENSCFLKNSTSFNEFQCIHFSNVAKKEEQIIREKSIVENLQKIDAKEKNSKNEIKENNSQNEIKELFRTQFKTFNEKENENCSNSLKFCSGGLCLGTKLFNSPKNSFSRLRGGGCYANNGREKQLQVMDKNFSHQLSMETLAQGACKSIWKGSATSKKKIGCGCFGKGKLNLKGNCSKKPCTGVDCFIRTLKETQEFVDSLGKIPGLAGLGLMDPEESPYFGRQEDDNIDTCQQKGKKFSDQIQSSDETKTSIKSKKVGENKSKDQIETPIYTAKHTLPFILNRIHSDETKIKINRKSKKVDNTKVKLQNTDQKLEETIKIEGGPCGDSECKSRKKIDNENSKIPPNEFSNASKSKTSIKNEHKNQKIKKRKKGSINTRNSQTSNTSPIKVSKNLMTHIYSLRERNPGIVYGHKNCLDLKLRVPKNMGWLWNSKNNLGRPPAKIGWKPGAINKYVYYLLKKAKEQSLELDDDDDDEPPTPVKIMKKTNTPGLTNFQTIGGRHHRRVKKEEESKQKIELPPTLHIHRKNGIYYITMYPIKAENNGNSDLQQTVKPLQFKITKDRENDDCTSESSISDMEIEFSPPAANNRYRVKPETKTIGTQLKQQDILDAYNKSTNLKSVKIKK